MMPTHCAVPLLRRGSTSTRMVEPVKDGLLRLAEKLRFSSMGSTLAQQSTLRLDYRMRDKSISISVVGTLNANYIEGVFVEPEICYLAHIDGLPGVFPVLEDEICGQLHALQTVTFETDVNRHHTETDVVDSTTSFSAVVSGMLNGEPSLGAGCVLGALIRATERQGWVTKGMERLLVVGDTVSKDPRDLKADFSYHVGDAEGQQTVRLFLDRRPELLQRYFPSSTRSHIKSGAKLLCRYGAAVLIGCAHDVDVGCVLPYWHVCGSNAGQVAPVFHSGIPILPVSEWVLEPSGPTKSCLLMQTEELRRYLVEESDSKMHLDQTHWVNRGIFGRLAGDVVTLDLYDGDTASTRRRVDVVVEGVRWNSQYNVLEQLGKRMDDGAVVILP